MGFPKKFREEPGRRWDPFLCEGFSFPPDFLSNRTTSEMSSPPFPICRSAPKSSWDTEVHAHRHRRHPVRRKALWASTTRNTVEAITSNWTQWPKDTGCTPSTGPNHSECMAQTCRSWAPAVPRKRKGFLRGERRTTDFASERPFPTLMLLKSSRSSSTLLRAGTPRQPPPIGQEGNPAGPQGRREDVSHQEAVEEGLPRGSGTPRKLVPLGGFEGQRYVLDAVRGQVQPQDLHGREGQGKPRKPAEQEK